MRTQAVILVNKPSSCRTCEFAYEICGMQRCQLRRAGNSDHISSSEVSCPMISKEDFLNEVKEQIMKEIATEICLDSNGSCKMSNPDMLEAVNKSLREIKIAI